MKRFKKLGILLGILVVVCVATVAVSQYEEKQEQIKNSSEVILQIPTDSVTSLSWEYEEKGNLAFHKDESGWRWDSDDDFPVSEDRVQAILSHFESFGVSFVIENVEDYDQYGLDDPECTFHIATENETYAIKLGDFSQMDSQRYVDIGDGNVYLVKDDPMEYVSSSLSDMILHDDTPGFETVVDIRFEGAESYMIQRLENSGYSYSDEDVYFTQENGVYLPLDKSSVTTYLNTITSVDLLDYVTYHATEEELESYGLDDPELTVTVNYTRTGEDDAQIPGTCVIHIGRNREELAAAREAQENGEDVASVSAYIRVGDSSIVYTLDSVDYDILSAASYDDLRHKKVFWGDFEDVTSIDVTLEDVQHVLVSEENEDGEKIWYYQTEEEAEQVPAGTDGETTEPEETEDNRTAIDLEDLKDALSALRANSFTQELPEGKEEIRMTLHLNQERFPTVELVFYRSSGTECLAVVDGQSVSMVPRASVMELVEAVQTIVLN